MSKTLVLVEREGRSLKAGSLGAVALAAQLGGGYSLALIGSDVQSLALAMQGYGADRIIVADHPVLEESVADRDAIVVAEIVRKLGACVVIGTSSTYTKDILPRVAALLDMPMVSDVTAVDWQEGTPLFQRKINAGSEIATVRVDSNAYVLTARGTAFRSPAANASTCSVEQYPVDRTTLPAGSRLVSRESRRSARPDLSEARVVVTGGRPLNDSATFERLIGGLADALGGAVGATRAAVDAGIAHNDSQVGQTGKVVAPELYIAVGVSGAIQHMAGIMDSRIIVAINRDPEAPVFQIANYGLVGDLHDIMPKLIKAIT